jgi:Fe2+ or Zn2+ uptake regulation protein
MPCGHTWSVPEAPRRRQVVFAAAGHIRYRGDMREPSRTRPRAPALPTEAQRPLDRIGQRSTRQRQAVYEYLRGVHHHPTAEDVYLAVQRRVPRVSLATVYNALELLVRTGLASKLTYGDSAARYDIRTDVHSHARCLACGRVDDVEATPAARWLRTIRPRNFTATGFRFEVLGRCRACRRRPSARTS